MHVMRKLVQRGSRVNIYDSPAVADDFEHARHGRAPEVAPPSASCQAGSLACSHARARVHTLRRGMGQGYGSGVRVGVWVKVWVAMACQCAPITKIS